MNLSDALDLDMQTMMTGRGCIIGQSGSGKSFLAGVISEELCRSGMPFCVIDTEGEYSSLKSMFNVIVVGGSKRDVDLGIDYEKLFRASINQDTPVVLDVSEALDKTEVVYAALQALYALESEIKKPYLVLIEEADKFAPQTISKSPNIIEEISVRGRKRGIGLLIATQRPANISKNVLSQCSYGFIGKLTIENDLNAIKILFENRDRLVEITRLSVGEFLPFGLKEMQKFRVKERAVKHMGTTPTIETYKPLDSKLSSIIKELKVSAQSPVMKAGTGKYEKSSLLAITTSFTQQNAKAYAERIAKRKFVMFGDMTEQIDSIDLKYLPLGLCHLRLPTKRKNEYLEYYALVNDKLELVRLDKSVKFLSAEDLEDAPNSYKSYLLKSAMPLEKIDAGKEQVMKSEISEKRAKTCVSRFLLDPIMVDFQIIHLPVYKITLKSDNKVRVFTIDAVYGKDLD